MRVMRTPQTHAHADTAAVEAATQSWIDAFNAGDPARICALYCADAVLWGTTAQQLIATPQGVRAYFDGHCAAQYPLQVRLTAQQLRLYGETAINSGSYTLQAVAGGQQRVLPARFSFVYRKAGGQWLIVDHHSSFVPAPL